jgi:transcriptional regulator with XRE-family HTH domain
MSNRKNAKKTIKKPATRAAGTLDQHFGDKLRARRVMMVPKISQSELGKALGVSFQQIQKYEKGANRMSAAMMVQMAAVLKIEVQYFFDDLPNGVSNHRKIDTPAFTGLALKSHGPRLIDAFLKIKNEKFRKAIADLAQTFAREDG